MKRLSNGSRWRLLVIGWLVSLSHGGFVSADIHSGLQVRYRFDDGGSTTATDSSTNSGRDGTLTNGAQFIPGGRVGGAVELDGANDFVDCPPIAATDGALALTVAFWLNTTSRSDSELLLSKYQSGGLFSIELGASGTGDEDDIVVYILTSGSAGYVYTTRNVLSDGTWIHVAVVFDGSQTGNTNRCRIYINGILADTTGSGSIPAALVNSPSDHWYIGWRDNQPANLSLHGKMDEFHLYTRALSQSDIQNSTSKAMAAFCSTARWRILARSSKMRPPTCLPAPTS